MSILMDLKYAFRQLLKAPKFTVLTLLVLVGGLSISLFTFSFLYSLIYKPLPLPDGDNIYRLSISLDGSGRQIPAYEFLQIRRQLKSVKQVGIFDGTSARLSIEDAGKTLQGTYVEKEIFEFTQTSPILGRVFSSDDMQAGAKPTVVVSQHTWANTFDNDENIIGKRILLNGSWTEVIGVMPKGFGFPVNSRLWLPYSSNLLNFQQHSDDYIQVYLKLNKGYKVEQAEAEIATAVAQIYQHTSKKYNKRQGKIGARLLTFPHAQTDGEGNLVFTFFNLIAFFILLLACINVGNLLLARAIEKRKEIAIRAALGAPIKRLTIQIMLEGIVITLLGGLLSLLLVGDLLGYTNTLLHSALSDNLPFWWHWGMSKETVLMAVAFTLITLFLASFLPAWRIANQDINSALRDGTRGAQSKKSGKASRIMVTAQVFLISTLMLIGSLSAFISHYLLNLEIGENFEQVVQGSIYLPEKKYKDEQQYVAFFDAFQTRIKQKENVIDSTIRVYRGALPISIESLGLTNEIDYPRVEAISLFGNTQFLGINLVEGRHLDQRDNHSNRKAVIVSESMVKRYWPGQNVLDKPIKLKIDEKWHTAYIVGIVTDKINTSSLLSNKDNTDEVYLSGYQFPHNFYYVYYKYQGRLDRAIESFYQVIYSLDKSIEPYRVEPADKNIDIMRSSMRLTSRVTFIAGGFALLLALTGIYGLTSNAVARRTHEIGIRRAVGATDREIIKMFMQQGSKQLFIGLTAGLVFFTLIAFVFDNFTDGNIPIKLYFLMAAVVSLGLTIVVLLAIYSPTSKAVEMEPNAALRYE
jgi:predicted permease